MLTTMEKSQLVNAAVKWGTPLYVMWWSRLQAVHARLKSAINQKAIKFLLSYKTQPVPRLLAQWYREGFGGVDVVSEFEYLTARKYAMPGDIVINGPGKAAWLRRIRPQGCCVNFDSLREVKECLDLVKALNWTVGIRFSPSNERDPDDPDWPTQFGLTAEECADAAELISSASVPLTCVHFHLRSNISDVADYHAAVEQVIAMIRMCSLHPTVIDVGGGLPALGVSDNGMRADRMILKGYAQIIREIPQRIATVREVWMENGRALTSSSAVLVVRVIDVKEREGKRFLVCDGGRVNHALVSDWEAHDVSVIPERAGSCVPTSICGPACMAFDWLDRKPLSSDIQVGDIVVWHNAGAYHLPWETRFSRGLAPVIWIGPDGTATILRPAETFNQWSAVWSGCKGEQA